jgi:hypothetical protein
MNLRDSNPQSQQSNGCRSVPEDTAANWPWLLTQNFLTISSQSQPSTPVSSSQKTEAERYSKRSACLYVTSPSTAVLMVLSRLSSDLVKL